MLSPNHFVKNRLPGFLLKEFHENCIDLLQNYTLELFQR